MSEDPDFSVPPFVQSETRTMVSSMTKIEESTAGDGT